MKQLDNPHVFQPIRVVIADDHPIVRDGLRALLVAEQHVQIVGVASSFDEVLALLGRALADIVVLDLGGMGGAALTLVTHLRRVYPKVAIVVFSSSVDLAPELVHVGISGYVVKEELLAQLLIAIHAAQAGQRFLSPIVEEYIAQVGVQQSQYRLAPRELHVLKLLAQGFSTVEIAEQLAIDPRSAQNYITTLRRKTNCATRTQLADWYQRMYGEKSQS